MFRVEDLASDFFPRCIFRQEGHFRVSKIFEAESLYLPITNVMELIRSELVLLLAGIASIIFLWLWLSAGNKQSSIPPNSARRSLTFRISSIPRGVDREKFRDILTRLPTTNSARELKWTLLGFSYSPSAAPSQAQRYAVATATFANAPTLSELEKSIKREIGIDASRLKVDSDFSV
ncbi:hypothetical protein TrVFT333_006843 [Trichoderma virens FT-333]|nr:hypothetical protein TrVFT333_006843 [Trichoderma virens FT-333]